MMVMDVVMNKVNPPTIRYKKLEGNADISLMETSKVPKSSVLLVLPLHGSLLTISLFEAHSN